jgi:hypothetical protein
VRGISLAGVVADAGLFSFGRGDVVDVRGRSLDHVIDRHAGRNNSHDRVVPSSVNVGNSHDGLERGCERWSVRVRDWKGGCERGSVRVLGASVGVGV